LPAIPIAGFFCLLTAKKLLLEQQPFNRYLLLHQHLRCNVGRDTRRSSLKGCVSEGYDRLGTQAALQTYA